MSNASGGDAVQLRPGALRDGEWDALAVETATPHRNVPLMPGETLRAPGGLRFRVLEPRRDAPLLWRMTVESGDLVQTLLSDGEPIRYSYVPDPVPLEHYQTVYAGAPGSVETPSAGRHLTWELLGDLRRRGIDVTDIVLHCGLSSFQDDDVDLQKPLIEEHFEMRSGRSRAHQPRDARDRRRDERHPHAGDGGRRQAVTSTRCAAGRTSSSRRRTTLRAVDALLTGLHEPPATHLDMLGALLDVSLLERAYAEVRERGYLWHEFGDAMLIL